MTPLYKRSIDLRVTNKLSGSRAALEGTGSLWCAPKQFRSTVDTTVCFMIPGGKGVVEPVEKKTILKSRGQPSCRQVCFSWQATPRSNSRRALPIGESNQKNKTRRNKTKRAETKRASTPSPRQNEPHDKAAEYATEGNIQYRHLPNKYTKNCRERSTSTHPPSHKGARQPIWYRARHLT